MEGHCFCLEENGELCDSCFNSWGSRYKCFEVDASGRPVSEPCPPTQPVESDDEMEDVDYDEEQGSYLESQSPAEEELQPVASMSEAYRPPPAAFVSPRRVATEASDPYGEYLKRMKTAK